MSTASIPRVLDQRITKGRIAAQLALVVAGSLVVAASAQVAIPVPFSLVPMTLQTLAVLLVGAVLGPALGAAALVLYIVEGVSGLPFFALGRSGPMVLAGPTAGYLLAFPFAAWAAGAFSQRQGVSHVWRALLSMFAASSIIVLGGFIWLSILTGPQHALLTGVVPFLPGEIVKVAIAAAILPMAERWSAILSTRSPH